MIINNPAYLNDYAINPAAVLANFGVTNKEEQAAINDVLVPTEKLQKMLLDNAKKMAEATADVVQSYQESLAKTNRETVRGFSSTMLMYQVSFYTGIGLIITAVVFAVVLKSTLFSIVFGSIGTIELLTFFIANPPVRLQESRSEHTRLNAAFYSWYVDLYNWNSFYLQLSAKGKMISYETIKQVSDSQIENTRKLMEIITIQARVENTNK